MTPTQRIIATSAVVVLLGVFIVSDFKWLHKKPTEKKDGQASADGTNPDPYMMLEVNINEFPNASGNQPCLTLNDITKK
jgi:hypothetical protein